MLVTTLAILFIGMGIVTLALTAIGVIGSHIGAFLGYCDKWDELATQGTILLSTIGLSLIISGLFLS